MCIFSSPHNPVGRVWEPDELRRVAEILTRHNIVLVSDEIHGDLIYKSRRQYSIAALCPEIAPLTITALSPSKTFNVAGLDLSYMIIEDTRLREAVSRQLMRNRISGSNCFALSALEAACTKCDDWVTDLLEYLEANLDYMEDFFKQHLPSLKMYHPEGTYLVWVDCTQLGLDEAGLEDFFIHKAKIAVDFGSWFGSPGKNHVRFNIGCPRSLLEEAMNRLENALNRAYG
jgi:cystathionine beta-lyase